MTPGEAFLRELKAEAQALGMPKAFTDDVQHLIDRLPVLQKARDKHAKNSNGQ